MTEAQFIKTAKNLASKLEGVKCELEAFRDEYRDWFDGKSEKWRESDKGQDAEQRADSLMAICDSLDSSASELFDMTQEG